MDAHTHNLRRHLLDPWYLLALVTLITNDRVLKTAFPGPVTGKLSDVAGVFVVAVAIGAITGRRTVAVAATGAGFAAIKVSAAAALLAAPVLGGVTLQDPTDLLALVVLVPAFRFLGRHGRDAEPIPATAPTAPISAATSGTSAGTSAAPSAASVWSPKTFGARLDHLVLERTGPVDARVRPSELIRRVGLVIALAATGFAVTATSCIPPNGYGSFLAVPEGVVALGDNELPDHVSTDGGRTWEPWQGSFDQQPPVADEACLDGDRCFRLADGNRVEERSGDTWTTAFGFTEDELDAITHHTGACGGPDLFRSIIAIDAGTDAAAGADATVLVAMGNDGVLRLDIGSDTWERIGIGEAQPKDMNAWVPGDSIRILTFLTPLFVAALSPALLFIRRRTVGARWRVTGFVVTLVGAMGATALAFIASLSLGASPAGVFRFTAAMAVGAVAIGAVSLAAVLLARGSSAGRPVGAAPLN